MSSLRLLSGSTGVLALTLAALTAQEHPRAMEVITPAQGGEVKAPSGKAVLTVPAGAVNADTEFTIVEREAGEGPTVGAVYDIGPDGLTLLKPATLTIRYAQADLPEDFEPEDVAITAILPKTESAQPTGQAAGAQTPPAGWDYLETTVDTDMGTASAQLGHLSRYGMRAYASYRLGDEDGRELRGMFDYGMKLGQAQGAGTADAGYGLAGELFAKATVPMGKEGMAMAHADIAKWFRVKAGVDGQRSTDKGVISVVIKQNAKLGADTNQYNMSFSLQFFDATPTALGVPHLVDPEGLVEGQFRHTGLLNQNFHTDPVFGHITTFPLGPRYRSGDMWVLFEQCKLEAGRFYCVHVGVNVGVTGQPADPEAGVPAKGGSVEFEGALAPHPLFIERISVRS